MKLNRMILITLPLSFISTCSFAFFCPSNFNQIQAGDTVAQVLQLCGKPDKEETKDGEASGPQEWNYYIPQSGNGRAGNQSQGSLKTTITFDANNKVINISVNGIGVGSSNLCGRPVSLGSTRDEVKSACGTPGFINKQDASSDSGATKAVDQITTFTYKSNPPATLTFTNGILTGQ